MYGNMALSVISMVEGRLNQQDIIPAEIENEFTLEGFVGEQNKQAVAALKETVTANSPGMLYIWGPRGAGKTHLIHAVCALAESSGLPLHFVSASNFAEGHQSLGDLLPQTLVCFDDIDQLGADEEVAILILSWFEVIRATQGSMVFSGSVPIDHLKLAIPDLQSRIALAPSFYLTPMNDDQCRHALKLRARLKGFELENTVVDFILRHFDRDTVSLFALLDRIDRASLSHQRKVTIPFIREILR